MNDIVKELRVAYGIIKKSQNEAIYFQYSHLGNMPDFCGKNHCCRHRSETTRNKPSSSVGHTL